MGDNQQAVEAPVSHPLARLTVLVVDDEPDFGSIVARQLRAQAEVLFAASIAAATELLATARIDVVLCDLNMPCGGGPAVEALIARAHPELLARTVYVTGGAFTPACEAFLARVVGRRLFKPFSPEALRAAVTRAAVGVDGALPQEVCP
jgi:CheY-like chemotaxis protein